MNTIAEIEDAIQKLPAPLVEELANWLEEFRVKRATSPSVDNWLRQARGTARTGETTASIMAFTRGEE